ncbi:HYR-like domain-containing protein, partial [Mariniflexile sp.]|uniref:HYR-like domain-containing protein n=1 Tax=Mariniflexile sp. TaxID=1979402 RepID=UPI00404713B5
GTYTINWTFDDGNGNSIIVPQTVIVKDVTAPVIDNTNIIPNIEIECGVGDTQTILTTWLESNAGATATDNCSAATWTNDYGSDNSVKCDDGAITVTFTATDAVGNKSGITATYLIKDSDAPIITKQAEDLTVECDGAGNIGDLNTWLTSNGGATATDSCSNVTWSNNFTVLSDDCGLTGSATVIFTASDACGNTASSTATFTIVDTTPPSAPSAPENITYQCIADVPAAGYLTAIDICGGAITSTGTDVTNDSDLCNITIIRTWTFTDECNNISTVSQTITVKDSTAPVLILPANVSAQCSDDLTPIAFGSATATDNCDPSPIIAFSDKRTDGDCPSTYTITRTWTATDSCGNVTTAYQIISTSDTTAPDFVETVLPQDITVECNAIPEAQTLTATDNCGTATVTVADVRENGKCPNNYIIYRTWTATDLCGLTRTYIQTITVQDTTPPVFVQPLPPTNLVVECDTVPIPVTLTATDICGTATVSVSDVRTNGSCKNNYTLARTWTAKDACGNETKYTQIIVVRDTKAPVFVEALPRDTTVECDAVPNAVTLTATDNCGSAKVTVMDVRTNGDCPNNYIIARTWTATDECGLISTHTQLITVQDTKAPVPDATFEAVLNVSCTDIPEAPALKFTDNCSANISAVFNETSTFKDNVYEDYVIERAWTVRDECNNEAVYKQTLNVSLDEIVNQIVAPDRCYDDGIINMNALLPDTLNTNGTWELLEGNPVATLTGNIFNPTLLELSADFLPKDGGIDYKFKYTTTNEGCISITEVTMNINADCVVLPCGENDIVISRAVTPNGDLINDSFYISGIELCGFVAEVKIFNRWGALIFESKKYPQVKKTDLSASAPAGSWNGTSSKSSIGGAGKVPNGTYYYIINFKNENGGSTGLPPFTGPVYLGTN